MSDDPWTTHHKMQITSSNADFVIGDVVTFSGRRQNWFQRILVRLGLWKPKPLQQYKISAIHTSSMDIEPL